MRAVTGTVVWTEKVSLSKAAVILRRFATQSKAYSYVRPDAAAYVHLASDAVDQISQLQRDLKHHSNSSNPSMEVEVKQELGVYNEVEEKKKSKDKRKEERMGFCDFVKKEGELGVHEVEDGKKKRSKKVKEEGELGVNEIVENEKNKKKKGKEEKERDFGGELLKKEEEWGVNEVDDGKKRRKDRKVVELRLNEVEDGKKEKKNKRKEEDGEGDLGKNSEVEDGKKKSKKVEERFEEESNVVPQEEERKDKEKDKKREVDQDRIAGGMEKEQVELADQSEQRRKKKRRKKTEAED